MREVEILFALAKDAQARAYAPYSRFPVGAALRTQEGAFFSGCNVENASFPLGLCAEASAIAAMIGAGERSIAEILIVGPGPQRLAPCGACRQRIAEFICDDGLVHLADPAGDVQTLTFTELLPHAFGPDALKR
jgi:cytidine deaminase